MRRIRIASGITLLVVVTGFFLMEPMSGAMTRYLLWRFSPSTATVRGRVQTDDALIHYVSFGRGPAILLLHGGLSNRLAWFSQIPWLVQSGHQVVVPDIRGHGLSGLGKKELNYRLLASDAVHVMNQLHIQKADVIGWSDGGNTALLLARYWPDRIRRMVSISANFSPTGLIPAALEDTHTRSRGLVYWFKRWWTGAGEHMDELESRIKRMWRTHPTLQPDDLKAIHTPTLVIVGDHDVVAVGHAERMAEQLPFATLDIVPGGHSTPVTQSPRINHAIAGFLGISPPA